MKSYLVLALSIVLGGVGQLFLKSGALAASAGLLNVKLAAGLAVYVVSVGLYVLALRELPLSVAFPAVSLSYVFVAYAAHLIWGEPFGALQVLGLVLIAGGIFLLTRT